MELMALSNSEIVQVKRAKPEAAPAIHDVLKKAFQGLEGRGYPKHAIEAAIKDISTIKSRILCEYHVLIAVVDGKIVGTVTGHIGTMCMHVKSFAVVPQYQCKGIGSLLLSTLESIARDSGCHKISLCTAWSMIEAAQLYAKLGYIMEGYLRDQFFGEDLAVFGKCLHR